MIEIKITINEGKTREILKDTTSTDVKMEMEVHGKGSTYVERRILEDIQKKLNTDKKVEIVDDTKEQKYKDLQKEIDSFLEFLEKHKDISLD